MHMMFVNWKKVLFWTQSGVLHIPCYCHFYLIVVLYTSYSISAKSLLRVDSEQNM